MTVLKCYRLSSGLFTFKECCSTHCLHSGVTHIFVSGLDPAGPLFEDHDWTVGINPSSADLVDIIHTNGESLTQLDLGTMRVLGHVDFYPNGGGRQPSCIFDPLSMGVRPRRSRKVRKVDPLGRPMLNVST